jgi:hypothetical protein
MIQCCCSARTPRWATATGGLGEKELRALRAPEPWDGGHPTWRAHQLLADVLAATLLGATDTLTPLLSCCRVPALSQRWLDGLVRTTHTAGGGALHGSTDKPWSLRHSDD